MTDESSAACNGTGNHNQDDTGRAQDPFYSNAVDYWGTVPANIEGMLGGFGHIHGCVYATTTTPGLLLQL